MRQVHEPSAREGSEAERPIQAPSLGRPVLINGCAPPTRGGTAIVVNRLFASSHCDALDVWTRVTQRAAVRRDDFVLPGRYHFFPKVRSSPRAPLVVSWVITVANVALAITSAVVVGRVARRRRSGYVVSVVDEGYSQIAGAVAARVAALPHVIWIFDVWEENAYARSDRIVARRLERRLWQSAAAIVVHAEELAEHYRAKHGVRAHVLRTPIDDDNAREPDSGEAIDNAARWEVLVAGSVYWAQAEALRRVAAAVRELPDASLTIIGDPALQSEAIDADRYEPPRHGAALQQRMRRAQLLVLALSFNSPHPEVVLTATPARLTDYLASGVPLLIHAPPRSHVVQHARRWDLATVVDVPDVEAVASAMKSMRADTAVSRRRAQRARQFALTQHSASSFGTAFADVIGSLCQVP